MTSTYESEEKSDTNLGTTSGCYTFPFQENFKILGCAVDRHGKTYDAVEERMQSANKAMKKIKGWETKTMLRLFRFKRHEDETWVLCHNGPCEMARKNMTQMGLLFQHEIIAESVWRAMGWACNEKSNTVINSIKKVYEWRSTGW